MALEQFDDGPLRPGVRFRGTAELLGDRSTWASEMTEIDEPRRMAWRTVETDAPARARLGPGTVRWRARPGPARLEQTHGGYVT